MTATPSRAGSKEFVRSGSVGVYMKESDWECAEATAASVDRGGSEAEGGQRLY